MNGKIFYGIAKEKERAAEEFEDRISAGENTGLVESRYVPTRQNRTSVKSM